MTVRPFASHYYPLMDPPCQRGYKVEIYDTLVRNEIMIYEVRKPNEIIPYCFVIEPYEDHLAFFHTLWNMDEFDLCAADRHFMMRLWHHLCPNRGPWNPAAYDISIEEEKEPRVYRTSAQVLIRYFINEELDRIKEDIGRFCMHVFV